MEGKDRKDSPSKSRMLICFTGDASSCSNVDKPGNKTHRMVLSCALEAHCPTPWKAAGGRARFVHWRHHSVHKWCANGAQMAPHGHQGAPVDRQEQDWDAWPRRFSCQQGFPPGGVLGSHRPIPVQKSGLGMPARVLSERRAAGADAGGRQVAKTTRKCGQKVLT